MSYGNWRDNPVFAGKGINASAWPMLVDYRHQILDQLYEQEIELVLPTARTQFPTLEFETPVVVNPGEVSSGKCSLFSTSNSKMACPTFSLPAARPGYGGTCPAEGLSDKEPHLSAADTFVCNFCYAGKANYRNATVQIREVACHIFVERILKNGGPEEFKKVFVSAIEHMISRLPEEMEKKAAAPVFEGKGSKRKMVKPHFITRTSQRPIFAKQHAHFFRIHDSGDFYSPEYLEGWIRVAEHFNKPGDKIYFWAPTRMWAVRKDMTKLFATAPDNFSIRPSALHISVVRDGQAGGSEPPVVPGSAAGSAVHDPVPGDAGMAIVGEIVDWWSGRNVWICPAYRHDNQGASCFNQHCRKCWTHQDLEVSYNAH